MLPLCGKGSLTGNQNTHRAGRHLLQAGQAVEDARRHARQLVPAQIKFPVGITDMS